MKSPQQMRDFRLENELRELRQRNRYLVTKVDDLIGIIEVLVRDLIKFLPWNQRHEIEKKLDEFKELK